MFTDLGLLQKFIDQVGISESVSCKVYESCTDIKIFNTHTEVIEFIFNKDGSLNKKESNLLKEYYDN